MPGLRAGTTNWAFDIDAFATSAFTTTEDERPRIQVRINLQDAAPYTTTVDILQIAENVTFVHAPKIRVRLYHDVEMAEVIAWDNHRHWLPVYTYPNNRMYLPDEKLVINRFLGEWLSHCLKLGITCDEVCESIRINGK